MSNPFPIKYFFYKKNYNAEVTAIKGFQDDINYLVRFQFDPIDNIPGDYVTIFNENGTVITWPLPSAGNNDVLKAVWEAIENYVMGTYVEPL